MDFLDHMEDVHEVAAPSRVGNLGFLAAAAARLSQDNKLHPVENQNSPVHKQRTSPRGLWREASAEKSRRESSPRGPREDKENRRKSPRSPREEKENRRGDSESPRRTREAKENRRRDSESPRERESPRGPREAKTALPHDLFFVVPKKCRPGQPVCVQGPHGPLRVPLPQGYQPGEQCRVRFGPMALHILTVPEGKRPGDVMKFEGASGEELETKVPPGKQEGDVFEVTPPTLMVQVPDGAVTGDQLAFTVPDGTVRGCAVPKGVQASQYFPVQI